MIQEVYRRYGKRGAAMTANVITYRGRSAAREIGKALNLSPDILNRFSNLYAEWRFPAHAGFTGADGEVRPAQDSIRARLRSRRFCKSITGLPRHLGQHSGGMIICQGKLDQSGPA